MPAPVVAGVPSAASTALTASGNATLTTGTPGQALFAAASTLAAGARWNGSHGPKRASRSRRVQVSGGSCVITHHDCNVAVWTITLGEIADSVVANSSTSSTSAAADRGEGADPV